MSDKWSPEKLDEFRADFVEAKRTIETQAEELTLLKRAEADLKELLSQRDADAAAKAKHVVSDDDIAVTRSYCVDPNEVTRGVTTRGASTKRPIMAHRDEGVAVRMYGAYDELGEYSPGLLDDVPKSAWQLRAQELAEEVSIVRACGGRPVQSMERFRRHMQRGPDDVRRVFTDAADYGEELLPDMTLAVLQREAEMSRGVEALFPERMIGPGGTKKNPFLNYGSAQMYTRSALATDDNDPASFKASDLDFDTRSLDPITLAGVLVVDIDAEEDAILAWASVARDALVRARVDAVEDAIINGDTAATHQDSGLSTWTAGGRWAAGSAKDHRKAWIGLRARAFDTSCTTDISAVATAKDYVKQLANLGVAHTFGDTVLMPSPLHFLASLATDADLWRYDGAGPDAAVMSGSQYQLWGRPIVLSQFNSDELNDSGLYDGTTTDYGSRLAFNRSRFEIAKRRGLRMSLETYEHKGVRYMTVTDRLIFRTFDGAATKNVHVGFKAPKS